MAELKNWAPDLPEHGHDGLVIARNAYASAIGYEPLRAPAPVTAALPALWVGGGAFTGSDGTTALVSATAAALYKLDQSAATSVYTIATTQPWYFAQFGNTVIGVNGSTPVKYDVVAGTGALLGGSPPQAKYVTVQSNDFVFMDGGPSAQSTVVWCAQNNPEGWTAGTGQSDVQVLPDGGEITGFAGGEFVLAFQAEQISLFQYIGAKPYFQRRTVARNVGAMCHGGIAQHDRQVFFYSRRGFYRYMDGEVAPIGRNKVDRTFRQLYTTAEIRNNLRCAIDPERSLVIWSMPDRLWVYNWDSDKWSDVVVQGIRGISSGKTASITLETIAVTFPAIEDVTPDLDDPKWRGGESMLLVAMLDNKLYNFGSSVNLEARFRLPNLEPYPGSVCHVRNCRVMGNMSAVLVNIDCRARLNDTATTVSSLDYRANGDVAIRASGKFIQPEIVIPAGTAWTSVEAFDIESTQGGRL